MQSCKSIANQMKVHVYICKHPEIQQRSDYVKEYQRLIAEEYQIKASTPYIMRVAAQYRAPATVPEPEPVVTAPEPEPVVTAPEPMVTAPAPATSPEPEVPTSQYQYQYGDKSVKRKYELKSPNSCRVKANRTRVVDFYNKHPELRTMTNFEAIVSIHNNLGIDISAACMKKLSAPK